MRRLFVLLVFVVSLESEIVDRVAIRIGYQPITELQIDAELRVTALLNHKPIERNANSRHNAADRLIQQFLIEREMQISRYPRPSTTEVAGYFHQVEEDFGDSSHLDAALRSDSLDRATLLQHLAVQLAVLRFIETRFRPEVSISDSDVRAFQRQHAGADEQSVRQEMTEKRVDEALSAWLEEARKRFVIVYLDKSLQ
jgi:hypothetical protein